MTTFFMGDELECYSVYTQNVTESTNMSISGYSRGNIVLTGTDEYVEAPLTNSVTGLPTATNDVLWLHVRRNVGTVSTGRQFTRFYDSSNNVVVREVRGPNSAASAIEFWNGTSWVVAIPNVDVGYLDNLTFDFKIKIGTSGSIEAFRQGILANRYTGDTSGIGNIAKVRFYHSGDRTWFHQVILADYSTVGHFVRRRNPTGNGFHKEWEGDYTSIDEGPSSTIGSDVIYTSVPNARMTFTGAALSAPQAGHVIKAVAVAEFSKNDGTGQLPQNVRPVLRASGVTYEGPVNAPINAGWSGGVAFWENNPATGAAWANIADVNATEFGVVAKD